MTHNHPAFLAKARLRPGFAKAYDELALEYALAHEMLSARARAALTQGAVAAKMGTTKSAVSRLESAGKHAPSLATLKRYASGWGATFKSVSFLRHAALGPPEHRVHPPASHESRMFDLGAQLPGCQAS